MGVLFDPSSGHMGILFDPFSDGGSAVIRDEDSILPPPVSDDSQEVRLSFLFRVLGDVYVSSTDNRVLWRIIGRSNAVVIITEAVIASFCKEEIAVEFLIGAAINSWSLGKRSLLLLPPTVSVTKGPKLPLMTLLLFRRGTDESDMKEIELGRELDVVGEELEAEPLGTITPCTGFADDMIPFLISLFLSIMNIYTTKQETTTIVGYSKTGCDQGRLLLEAANGR